MSSAPATIVDWIEKLLPEEPLTMSEPSKTWVDRMWHAMIDSRTTPSQFDELHVLYTAHLDRLDQDERRHAEDTALILTLLLRKAIGAELRRCRCCYAIVCPHCGRHEADCEETPAA